MIGRRGRMSFAYILLLALLVPILAACGGTAAPATEEGAAPTTAAPATDATEAPAAGTTEEEPVATTMTEEEPVATTMTEEEPAVTATTEETAATDTGATGETGATGDNVLRIHQPAYPDVFDPQKSSYVNEISILAMNYEGLTRLDAEQQPSPAAAESWEFNEAGDEITFTLREGLTYSDGSPLTSENFRYAAERGCDPETAGEYASILFEIVGCAEFASTPVTDTAALEEARGALGVSTPDEQTITFQLTNVAPYFPYIAGLWILYPAKQELIEEGGETWWQNAEYHVGNGPFQITSIDQDQLITFEANENYWAGQPALDGLEYVYIDDSQVALEAYNSGQLDIMEPDPSQLPAIEGDPALSAELLRYPNAATIGLQYNLTKEPFNDPKVREAFAYAFDRETYCSVIRNGDCLPTLSWVPEGVMGAIETDQFAYDPEAAKQALAESTYGGPENLPELTFTYSSNDPANQPRAEWIAGQFRDVLGVEVTLEPLESAVISSNKKDNATYPMMSLGGWIQDYPDPQNWLSVFWKCSATFAQRQGYCNEEFDALVTEADTTLDQEERARLYEEASEILVQDQPAAFLYNPANIFLVKPEVQGYQTIASDSAWPGQWVDIHTVTVER